MAVMGALCAGPNEGGAVAALPQGTRPLAAFYDEGDGSIVLDFSRELVTNHPGGTAAGYDGDAVFRLEEVFQEFLGFFQDLGVLRAAVGEGRVGHGVQHPRMHLDRSCEHEEVVFEVHESTFAG